MASVLAEHLGIQFMLDEDMERESGKGINIWISFADLFAGLLLITLLGLAIMLPHYRQVRFSRHLVATMNKATEITHDIQALLTGQVPLVQESETQIVIPEAALFRSGRFDDFLKDPEKRRVLSVIRDALRTALDQAKEQRAFLRVVIEGHTDNVKINSLASTEAIKTNWELSSRRATGVLRFFEEGGLDSKVYNIVAMGYADSVPVATNDTEEGRAKNRRIVIRIEPNLEAIKKQLPEN